jgi:hypothetical protein
MTDDTPDLPNDPESNDSDYVDPDLPTGADPDDAAPALSPEDLEIADNEYVEKLDDDGRYVVSPGGGPPNVPDSAPDDGDEEARSDRDRSGTRSDDPRQTSGRESAPAGPQRPVSPESARTLLAGELERSNARYGLDIVARFEGDTVRHRTVSDDVIGSFESLVRWYASHVTDGTPAEEVVAILLRESSFETGETPNLAKLLRTHGLDRTDSIDDLVAAIREESDRA